MICTRCGTTGETKSYTKGSVGMELLLWICGGVPGLIYSIWRLTTRYRGCPSCGSSYMIDSDSPAGKKLMKDFCQPMYPKE